MGPFFYSKYEIPANSDWFKSLSSFKFLFETPPNTTTFFLVHFASILNLLIPKKFLFFLNAEERKIFSTF